MDGDDDAEFDGFTRPPMKNGAHENDPLRDRAAVRISFFLREPWPAMRWVLKNCLPLGILGLLAAQGGIGKSRLIIQLAFCLALGRRFLDTWDIGEPGASLLLFAEDDRDELHRRIGRLAQVMSLSPDEMELIDERVHVASVVDQDNYITNKNADGDVQETNYPERIVRLAKEIHDLKLIVFDPPKLLPRRGRK
jgi:RecA-family ATPase